ncbi:MAG TPA: multidrug ABC transporter ATP-binding protein [Lachnospiraceae bacterium]|nr:multidrug ABC transporter ATP-binding protein [Lachnospiraceae bacterium]
MSGQKPTSSLIERGFRPGNRPMNMGAPVEKAADRGKTLRRLIRFFKPEIASVIILAIVVIITVVASVLAPGFQSKAIDDLVDRKFGRIPQLLVIILVTYIIHGIATLIQGFISAKLSARIIDRLRNELFDKIVNLPITYIDTHSHGDIMSRMTNDAENVSNVISQSLSSLFSGILTLAGTLIVMMTFSIPLTLLTCTTVILTVITTKVMSHFMRKLYLKRQVLLGELNGIVEEKVTDIKTVTAYNLQEETIENFEKASDVMTKTGIIADIIGNAMGPVMNTISNISFVIVAAFGAWFAVRGDISIGVISAFIIYSKQFSRPINELAQLYGQIETAIAGAERIFTILDENDEDKSGDKDFEISEGVIEFKNVDFSYVPGQKVINNFSLKIEAGKKIALVGSTGSGKTTIVNLLMRFYDIDSGEITVDGRNIKDISAETLRDSVGIVLQDSVLFSDTLRNNMKYADEEISDEKMVEAAKLSHVYKVAERLPEGYDTYLASAGANLSQGQRQMVTIGRAFLSYPKILILDEATSSVDTRTEKHIQNAMVRLMKNRTSLIIAHRLSTIRDADMIVVMDKGHIIESGSHDELIEKKGNYYNLYMTQFAGIET